MTTRFQVSRAMCGACLILAPLVGCVYGTGRSNLGVLPPQPPIPFWMGPVRNGTLGGAAAVVPYATPGWVHVMVSIEGAQPGTTYSWSLDTGACASAGSAAPVAGTDRFTTLVAFSDGHASAEALVPAALAASGQYSVIVSAAGAATTPAGCADLVYGGM